VQPSWIRSKKREYQRRGRTGNQSRIAELRGLTIQETSGIISSPTADP
jgi:hypothetical protein